MTETLVAVVVIAALVGVGVWFFQKNGGAGGDEDAVLSGGREDLTQPYEEERIVETSQGDVLSAFPDDFPAEAGISADRSYKYIPANSTQQQSTLDYKSQKTFAENVALFGDYIRANGYELVNESTEEGFHFFYGTRERSDLSISIEQQGEAVMVSVSYLTR